MNLILNDNRLVILLSAIDGLVLGITSELLYGFYYHWEFQRAADYAYEIGSKIAVERGPLILHNHFVIPILYLVSFLIVAYLYQWILGSRASQPLIFFQVTAVSGVTLALIFYFSEDIYREFHFLAQPSARHRLLGVLIVWIVSVAIACLANLFFGVIVQALDRRNRSQRFVSG